MIIIECKVTENKIWEYLFSLGSSRTYKPGQVIYLKKEDDVGLYCIKKGTVKNCVYLPNGKEKTIVILDSPAITGETAVMDGGVAICSAVALTRVEVVRISKERLNQEILAYPELSLFLMKIMTQKMRSLMFQAESVHLSISKRLARMLINFNISGVYTHDQLSKGLVITHELFASFLGTTRPRITEYLNDFADKDFIEIKRGHIIVKDTEGLQEYIDS